MKTAVSLPEDVLKAADRAAKLLGISRNEFYVRAIRAFLERPVEEDVTERFNKAYANEDSSMDPVIAAMQAASIDDGGW